MRLCNIRLPYSLPPPLPPLLAVSWQSILYSPLFKYSFDDECTLRLLPLKTCDPPQTNTPPYPPSPPQGMKSDCLPLVYVDCVGISVHKYIFIYFFFF